MIITVTLNAALDKTLEVPNFTPGPPASDRRPDHDAGRQGRQRRPRAQAPRPAGDRHRPGGRRDRQPDRRGAQRRGDPQRLRPDPRGVADEHGRARSDHRPAHRDQRARARRSRRRSSSCSATSCCTWPRAPACACSPAACRAAIESDVYAGLIREVRRLGVTTIVDTDGEPLRLAVRAEPDVDLPQRARGRGARRARVQRHRRPRPGGRRDAPARGRRGDHDRARRLLRPGPRGRRADARTGSGSRSRRRARASAPATRSWPATSPPATSAARRSTACATGWPAAPSRSSTSAPGLLDPVKVDRLLAEVEAERLEIRAEIG